MQTRCSMAQQDKKTPEALPPYRVKADPARSVKKCHESMQGIQAELVAHHIDRFRDSRGLGHQCHTESLSEQKA